MIVGPEQAAARIAQWMIGQLRHSICRVLRDVEADERVQVTVDGRPVADISVSRVPSTRS